MNKRAGIKSIFINATYTSASQFLVTVSRTIYVVVIARMLTPELYGLISYSLSWYNAFLPITYVGLTMILGREIGHGRDRAAVTVPHTLAIRAAAALVVSIVCGLAGWMLEPDPTVRIMLLLAAAALMSRAITAWTESVYIAFEASRYRLLQDVICRPLEMACGIVVLLMGGGGVELLAVHAASWTLQGAYGLWAISHRFVAVIGPLQWFRIRDMLRAGFIFGMASALSGWLTAGPIVLFRHFETPADSLGPVALALQIFNILSIVPVAVGVVALPVLSRSVARGDRKDSLFVDNMCRMATLLGIVATLGSFVLGPWLTRLLFGAAYELTGSLMGWVTLLLIPFSSTQVIIQVLAAHARPGEILIASAAGALVMTLLFVPLVQLMGPLGLVLAAGTGMAVQAIIAASRLAPLIGTSLPKILFLPWLIAGIVITAFLAGRFMGDAFALAASVFLLLLGTWAFGIIRVEERAALRAMIRSRLASRSDRQG